MPLPMPVLDDRRFADLVAQAQERMRRVSPGWTAESLSDPGMVLLDAFAHLTETLLYRVNRIPEKAYVAFLGVLGVRLAPPTAARVELRFARAKPSDKDILIPAGTLVAAARADAGGEPPVFATLGDARLAAGQTEAVVAASHGRWIAAEDAGVSTGAAGQEIVARQAPIVAAQPDAPSLIVAIEAGGDAKPDAAKTLLVGDVAYEVWDEVEDFTGTAGRRAYIADRASGRVLFAPAARTLDEHGVLALDAQPMARVPPAKRRMRLWYRAGGGLAGNVAANALTVLKTPIEGVTVSNPKPATGGRPAETVENALARGPQEFYSVRRAVTAFDYELIATRASRAIWRAKAYTRASLAVYAQPGAVDVLLVPAATPGREERPTAAALASLQSDDARAQVQAALEERKPIGATVAARWAPFKTVHVQARVVVQRHENQEAVRSRVLAALDQRLSPMGGPGAPGWGFGETLRVSHIYDIVLGRPGVGYVDQVRLLVDEAPDQEISALAADPFQPRTWYAGSGERLFVSGNDGDGWERAASFAGARVTCIRAHPEVPGLVAAVAQGDASTIHVSADCGQTWRRVAATEFRVDDLAWSRREGQPLLFLATDNGLFELAVADGSTPLQVLVDPAEPTRGYYAVAVASHRGDVTVIVAGASLSGVWLSNQGGRAGTFRTVGLKNEDVRILAILRDDHRFFLWAGLASIGNDPGKGCLTAELNLAPTQGDVPLGWRWANKGWTGGSCKAIAFHGQRVFAATHRAGVLLFDDRDGAQTWAAPAIDCGLPLRSDRDAGPLQPVEALAADPGAGWLLAGGKEGVLRAAKGETPWTRCAQRESGEQVLIPPTWLLAAGDHRITVVSYDEAGL